MNWTKTEKRIVVLVVLLIAAADQLVKYSVVAGLSEDRSIEVLPGFFNLVLAHNRGVAFGIFAGIGSDPIRYLILALTTAVALAAVFMFARSETCHSTAAKVYLGMILGGAAGNLIDRARLGAVVDYLDFHVGVYHWPAFNLADSAICVAVFLLLFLPPKHSRQ